MIRNIVYKQLISKFKREILNREKHNIQGCPELYHSITGDVIVQGRFCCLGALREGTFNADTFYLWTILF
jgi:hypothetical protein